MLKKDDINNTIADGDNTSSKTEGASLDTEAVTKESINLLRSENIITALTEYTANTEEKKIAMEYIKSYANFLEELTKKDLTNKIERSDVQIRDLISHVNVMMRQKNERMFTTLVVNSNKHYANIKRGILAKEALSKTNDNKS